VASRHQGRCPDLGDDHRSLSTGFTHGLPATPLSARTPQVHPPRPRPHCPSWALCLALTLSIPAALVILWLRAPRSSRWALPALLAGALLGQATAVGVDARRKSSRVASASTGTVASTRRGHRRWAPGGTAGCSGGRLWLNAVLGTHRPPAPDLRVSFRHRGLRGPLRGPKVGIWQAVIAWLSPQYHDRDYAKIFLPAVTVRGGAAGHIRYVIDRLTSPPPPASRSAAAGRRPSWRCSPRSMWH